MFLRLELEEEEADLRHRASCITHDRAKREASPAEVLVFESVTCICAVGTLNGTICFFFANLKVVQLAVQGRLLQNTLLMQYNFKVIDEHFLQNNCVFEGNKHEAELQLQFNLNMNTSVCV